MIIDGKQIASSVLSDLKLRVNKLKKENITPHLYIFLLSDDVSSASYVNQKIKRGEEIGVKITLEKENPNISTKELIKKIKKLNVDNNVHGIIAQRPMPAHLDEEKIEEAITPTKDVDGFNSKSKFVTPVASAVLKILQSAHSENFEKWLKTQNITVVGRGLTAGGPIIKTLQEMNINPNVISSKTENRSNILRTSDIVIVAVGKSNVINSKEIKQEAVVIGVGMHKETDGKFHGDFNEEEISKKVSFYTPTPRGVGPVNVSMLLTNLVTAAESLN